MNEKIRVPEVRLVGPAGEQVGIVRVEDAMRLARESDLDLVEVAPTAKPPVAKLMDFGKYKYEAAMKARESRKNQSNTSLKEVRFRLKIDDHDYDTKVGHAKRFLSEGDKVKAMIQFRGREQSRPEMGVRLLGKLAEDLEEFGQVESSPRQDGRNMVMVLGPLKTKSEAKSAARRAKEAESDEDSRLPSKVKSSRRDRERDARESGAPATGDAENPLPVGGSSIGESIPEELRALASAKFEVPEGAPPLKVSEDQPPVVLPKEDKREPRGGGRGRQGGGPRSNDRGGRPSGGSGRPSSARPESGSSSRPSGGGRPSSSGPRSGSDSSRPPRSSSGTPRPASAPQRSGQGGSPRPAGGAGRPAPRPSGGPTPGSAPRPAPKPGTAPKPGGGPKPGGAPKPGQ
ncbi:MULTISPECIES: translation initiation factor IF-3 [unclassified Kocuria]|uniref:translation initiation factor IF-3 n=1 Tax=unclassified Kocuria TaxID=2649579 RepID=UPI0021A61ABC|nr:MULTISPECIES: translation initiation factor IF-3 [unclassified Kocuria]